jgi:hypothetical protein
MPTAPAELRDSIPKPVQLGEAIVPTITPRAFIDQILVGYRVNHQRRDKLMAMLQKAGLDDRVEIELAP